LLYSETVFAKLPVYGYKKSKWAAPLSAADS